MVFECPDCGEEIDIQSPLENFMVMCPICLKKLHSYSVRTQAPTAVFVGEVNFGNIVNAAGTYYLHSIFLTEPFVLGNSHERAIRTAVTKLREYLS